MDDEGAVSAVPSPVNRVAWITVAVVGAVLAFLVLGSLLTTLRDLDARADQLTQSVARVQAANQELQAQRDRAATDAGLEDSARGLGLLKPGERAIVPRPENSGVQGRQPFQPDREGERVPNWKRWWRWFFGDPTRPSR